jgi:hypothetical protein
MSFRQQRFDVVVREDFLPKESIDLFIANLPRLVPARDSLFYVPTATPNSLSPERERELDAYLGEGTGKAIIAHIKKTLDVIGPQEVCEVFFRASDGVSTSHYGPLMPEKGMFHRDTSGWAAEDDVPVAKRGTPEFSTITFLAPTGPLSIDNDGATYVFLDRTEAVFEKSETWFTIEEATALSPSYVRVPLRVGRSAIFDGACAHMVSPFRALPEGTLRVTMLLNFWSELPKIPDGYVRNPGGINRVHTPRDYELMCRLGPAVYPFLSDVLTRIRGCNPEDQDEIIKLLHTYVKAPSRAAWPWGTE